MAASRRRTKSIRLAIPDLATLDALHNVDGSKCYDEADLRGIELIRPEVAAQHSEYERSAVGRELLRRLWPYEDEWIQKTHWIATKEGKLSLLVWNPVQRRLYDLVCKLKKDGRFVRVINLKARQLGCSTFIQSLQYEWCDANPNRIALTIAHVDKSSIELFRKSKTIHRRLWFPRSTERDASGVFEFSDPHSSSFFVFTAGNPDAGASQTFHHGHLSELPRWPNPSETLTSMAPAIAPTLDSSVFIESTAQGAIGEFYERWIRAEQGKGDYVPFFAPWFEEPKYASPFADDEHRRLFLRGMSAEDREYQTRYKLSPEQMRWRRYQIDTELNGSEARFRQEYPSNAMEAFLTSGMPVFNPPEHILDLRAQCAKPQWTGDLVLTRA